jgi:hypothetical protein
MGRRLAISFIALAVFAAASILGALAYRDGNMPFMVVDIVVAVLAVAVILFVGITAERERNAPTRQRVIDELVGDVDSLGNE